MFFQPPPNAFYPGELEIPVSIAFAFGFATTFLLLVHTVMILKNWSTIEFGYLCANDIYKDQSYMYKWCLIFGQNPLLWFIPVRSTDPIEGLDYKANIPILANGQPAVVTSVSD